MQEDSLKNSTPTDANNVLAAGYSFKLGDFQLWLDEDTGEPEKGFFSYVREDGRITMLAITLGANTGRFRHRVVCNIPRVTSLFGEEMRGMFGCGDGLLQLAFDFSSLENRIMGHYVMPFKDGKQLAESMLAEKPWI